MKFAQLPYTMKIENYAWNHQSFLGSGTQAQVYLGHDLNKGSDQSQDNLVAIKIFDNYFLQDEYKRILLENEIKIMSKLKECSGNVLALYDSKKDEENTYIIQMFCNQGDFRSLLIKEKYLQESKARQILLQLIQGYKNLQKLNIFHRDLKPENILIHNNEYKIADYGLSVLLKDFEKEQVQDSCGSPLYSSPQVLMGKNYSSKSDVWSLGVIYYECVTGTTPWECSSLFQLVQEIKSKPVQFPSNIELSDESKDFLRGCLQFKEENRFSWSQVFEHPLIIKQNKELVIRQIIKFSPNVKENIIKLQTIIQQNSYNEDNFFKKYFVEETKTFNKESFQLMIEKLDSNIPQEQVNQLFQELDINYDGQLVSEEFQRLKKIIKIKSFLRLIVDTNYKEPKKNILLDEQKAKQLMNKLIDKIYKDDLSLKELLKKYDISNNKQLEFNEFYKLLLEMDNSILEHEGKYIFDQFDENNNGSITLEEFEKQVVKRVEELGGDPENKKIYPEPQIQIKEQSLRLLKRLRKIVIKNKLNVVQIMKNHDIDRSNALEYSEFMNFVLMFDQEFPVDEIQVLFEELDKDHSNSIDIKELKLALQYSEEQNQAKIKEEIKEEKKQEIKEEKQQQIKEEIQKEKQQEIKQEINEEKQEIKEEKKEEIKEEKKEEIKEQIKEEKKEEIKQEKQQQINEENEQQIKDVNQEVKEENIKQLEEVKGQDEQQVYEVKGQNPQQNIELKQENQQEQNEQQVYEVKGQNEQQNIEQNEQQSLEQNELQISQQIQQENEQELKQINDKQQEKPKQGIIKSQLIESSIPKEFQFPRKIEPVKKLYEINPQNLDDPVGYLQKMQNQQQKGGQIKVQGQKLSQAKKPYQSPILKRYQQQ